MFSDEISQPWNDKKSSVTSMEIGSNIQPISTVYWAEGLTEMTTGDFAKLDTSQATDISGMFASAGSNATTFNVEGLSTWDTSRVTDMSGMFYNAGYSAKTWSIGDLSNWDTSSVTYMSTMFYRAGVNATTFNIGDISNWIPQV
ncbi:MAG: BspA family leucine-rich repeat surface protein [Bacilli bacterium]